MEMRLSNIFKTTNVSNSTKSILKSSYTVLQVTFTQKTLKQPICFLKAVKFCSTFWHSSWHNFSYISRKVAKPRFLESPQKPKWAVKYAIAFFQISNYYCQKSYDGFRVFLGSSTTSQIFLIYTFLIKKRRPF